MKNIAIVEDEDDAAALLTDYVKRHSAQSGQEFNVARFNNAVDFLADYKAAAYAVVFMDIQMPGKDGMTAAEELRKKDKTVSIVFITSLIQYAQKGYEVDAVAYLLKPVQYYDFALKFRKALDVYAMNEEQDITITVSSGMCRVSTDKLMYVEIVRHKLIYHLVDDVLEVTGVLQKAEDELKTFGFLRCNQCYLVNPKFIKSVNGLTVRVGNEDLAISRPRKNSFMTELANWYAGSDGKRTGGGSK